MEEKKFYKRFSDKDTLIRYCKMRKNSIKRLSEEIHPKDIDREIMQIFIKKSGEGLKYLVQIKGEEYLDYDLCKESVLNNSFSIKFVPKCFLDEQLIKLAVEDNIYNVRHLRKEYHTEEFHKWLLESTIKGVIFEKISYSVYKKAFVFTVMDKFKNITYKTAKLYLETFLNNPEYVTSYNGSIGHQISTVETFMTNLKEIDSELLLMYIDLDTRLFERRYGGLPVDIFKKVKWTINDINKAILMLQMSKCNHYPVIEYLRNERSRLECQQ